MLISLVPIGSSLPFLSLFPFLTRLESPGAASAVLERSGFVLVAWTVRPFPLLSSPFCLPPFVPSCLLFFRPITITSFKSIHELGWGCKTERKMLVYCFYLKLMSSDFTYHHFDCLLSCILIYLLLFRGRTEGGGGDDDWCSSTRRHKKQ